MDEREPTASTPVPAARVVGRWVRARVASGWLFGFVVGAAGGGLLVAAFLGGDEARDGDRAERDLPPAVEEPEVTTTAPPPAEGGG